MAFNFNLSIRLGPWGAAWAGPHPPALHPGYSLWSAVPSLSSQSSRHFVPPSACTFFLSLPGSPLCVLQVLDALSGPQRNSLSDPFKNHVYSEASCSFPFTILIITIIVIYLYLFAYVFLECLLPPQKCKLPGSSITPFVSTLSLQCTVPST